VREVSLAGHRPRVDALRQVSNNASTARQRFLGELQTSLEQDTFVRLLLSRGRREDRLTARLVQLGGEPHLSVTIREGRSDVTRNLPLGEALDWVREHMAAECQSALLSTTQQDWQWQRGRKRTEKLVRHQPATTEAPPRSHDQPRSRLLDASANDWLHALGVVDAVGKVRASMADKHRQIQHYVELLSHLAADCGWTERAGEESPSRPDVLSLADMGCGKGYLTFAAWHLFHRILRLPVRVLGVEARTDLVEFTLNAAAKLHAHGLEFRQGDIEQVELPRLDGLIALHACNTATDAAIRRGIELGAKLIVVAPCCHQELRPQIQVPSLLAPISRHGILEERLAEWLTDGLRALYLEWAGYRTKVIEFIATEHTPKNLMIAAVREGEPFTDPPSRERIERLQAEFGIRHYALDALLNPPPTPARRAP
jgi:SAM-dependent methyltransferase